MNKAKQLFMWCEREQMGALASAKQPPRAGPAPAPRWLKEHTVLKVSRLCFRKCLNIIARRIYALNSASKHTVCEALLEALIHDSHAIQGKHGASASTDTHLTMPTFSSWPITQLLFYLYINYGRNLFSKTIFFLKARSFLQFVSL